MSDHVTPSGNDLDVIREIAGGGQDGPVLMLNLKIVLCISLSPSCCWSLQAELINSIRQLRGMQEVAALCQ